MVSLEEMMAFEKQATPGPWTVLDLGNGLANIQEIGTHSYEGDPSLEDARFISASREYVPWSFRRIKLLENDVEGLKLAYDLLREEFEETKKQIGLSSP